jgi:flagella basal body P-ring formation protein FlgA
MPGLPTSSSSRRTPAASSSPWSRPRTRPRPPRPRHSAFLCALLLGALCGGGPRVFAFPGATAFELLPAIQVDSSGVFLHQILAATSASLPPEPVRLADAPAFGRSLTLPRAQIEELLARQPGAPRVTNWSGAPQVRITRRARSLTEPELRQLLTATLQRENVKDRGELELRFSRPWAQVLVPDETLVLRVLDLPVSGLTANFIVRFELQAGVDRLGPWQVLAQARIMKDILVSRGALPRGQPLQGTDFVSERRDVLSLREPLDENVLRNPSLELVEGISAGQPLLARSVRMRPVVQRGQMVDGVVQDGALRINMRVEVLGDGLPGQLVRVRNPKTKREFYARVQDDQTVLINL